MDTYRLQIEDEGQQDIVSEDDMSDFKSPVDEIVSPASAVSQGSRGEMVRDGYINWVFESLLMLKEISSVN
jgi:hypothetical protein